MEEAHYFKKGPLITGDGSVNDTTLTSDHLFLTYVHRSSPVFHDSISDRSVRSLSGFLLLAVACVNDLTMCPQSSEYWKYYIILTFKF